MKTLTILSTWNITDRQHKTILNCSALKYGQKQNIDLHQVTNNAVATLIRL